MIARHPALLTTSSRNAVRSRDGFTLIELLVAMMIFVILVTLTVGAFNGVNKDDQVSAGAQLAKGWFHHARSLSMRDKLARGVRLTPDMTSASGSSPRLLATIAYIGASGYEEGDLTPALVADRKFLMVDPMNTRQLRASDLAAFSLQQEILNGTLDALAIQSYGLRIEVPRNSGQWYSVTSVNSTGTAGIITISQPVYAHATLTGIHLDYRLELGPSVLPDAGTNLPRGIVIDLDSSVLPNQWRPTTPGGPYSSRMDIMFTPQGNFDGRQAAQYGVIHLVVSTVEDANAIRNQPTAPHPEFDASAGYPFIVADPKTPQKIVSLFLNSGNISSSNVMIPDSVDPASDGLQNTRMDTSVINPFSNALRGKEAK